MAQPPRYQRTKDFGADYPDQTDNQAINNELDAVSQTTDGIRKNLALVQSDDGGLKHGIVTKDALAQPLKEDLYDEFSQNVGAAVQQAQQAAGDANTAALAAANSAVNAANASAAAQNVPTDHYGPNEPAVTWPGMVWADSNTNTLKRRDAANASWVIEARLFRAAVPIIPADEIPTTDIGPINVPGKGNMEWEPITSQYIATGGGATGGGADKVFYINGSVMTQDMTIEEGDNAHVTGPLDIQAVLTVKGVVVFS